MLLKRKALISVTDKRGVVDFARTLQQKYDFEIYSSSGTASVLKEAGIQVTPVESLTGNPEAFGGRMKTISFQLGSALLYRRSHRQDNQEAKKWNIPDISLVVCNLYPFEETVKKTDNLEEWIENIDIGGPLILRAAAKNYKYITTLIDPQDYTPYLKQWEENPHEGPGLEFRQQSALKVWERIMRYDTAIYKALGNKWDLEGATPPFEKVQDLRYGENPHQKASWYKDSFSHQGFSEAKILQGKELSYNNLLDCDVAIKLVSEMKWHFPNQESVTVIKHGNPCGVAMNLSLVTSFQGAWEADPLSRFGSVMAFSNSVSAELAHLLVPHFIEIILAPSFTQEAKDLLSQKKNLRLIEIPLKLKNQKETTLRSFWGGYLVQNEDEEISTDWVCPTQLQFQGSQKDLVLFGLICTKYLKSNAISLVAQNEKGIYHMLGGGSGQPNRVESFVQLAYPRYKKNFPQVLPEKMILISDAFLPFSDLVEEAYEKGIRFIVQPGGSIKDQEIIDYCNEKNVSMLLTKKRHFRH